MSEKMINVSETRFQELVASACQIALAELTAETDTPTVTTIATVNAKTAAKVQKNSRKRQKAATKVAPAPVKPVTKHYDTSKPVNSDGFITGLLAAEGTSYKLIDKSVNTHTQCSVRTCKVLRKGRSRFCPAHMKSTWAAKIAKS